MWALTKNNPPWQHPLPSIKKELENKAQGRVFQMDSRLPVKPVDEPDAAWNEFLSRVVADDDLYFEYKVLDM
jgi:hypothetical protein